MHYSTTVSTTLGLKRTDICIIPVFFIHFGCRPWTPSLRSVVKIALFEGGILVFQDVLRTVIVSGHFLSSAQM